MEPGILYDVELKEMHNKKGFVVVSATPRLFKATLETTIKPKFVYKITISFGHKVIYFDPKHGKTAFSRTLEGVLEVLNGRQDIENKEQVIKDFKKRSRNAARPNASRWDDYLSSRKTLLMMERPHEGIATDTSHSMKYGVTRFRGVDLKDGRELFSHDIG